MTQHTGARVPQETHTSMDQLQYVQIRQQNEMMDSTCETEETTSKKRGTPSTLKVQQAKLTYGNKGWNSNYLWGGRIQDKGSRREPTACWERCLVAVVVLGVGSYVKILPAKLTGNPPA